MEDARAQTAPGSNKGEGAQTTNVNEGEGQQQQEQQQRGYGQKQAYQQKINSSPNQRESSSRSGRFASRVNLAPVGNYYNTTTNNPLTSTSSRPNSRGGTPGTGRATFMTDTQYRSASARTRTAPGMRSGFMTAANNPHATQSKFRELRMLKAQVKDLRNVESTNEELKSGVDELQYEMTVAEQSNAQLRDANQALENEVTDVRYENSLLMKEIVTVVGERANVSKALKAVLLELDEVKYHSEQVRADVDRLGFENGKKIKGLMAFFTSQLELFNKTKAENEALVSRLSDLEGRHAPCDKEIVRLQQRVIDSEQKIEQQAIQLHTYKQGEIHFKETIAALEENVRKAHLEFTHAAAEGVESQRLCVALREQKVAKWWEVIHEHRSKEELDEALKLSEIQGQSLQLQLDRALAAHGPCRGNAKIAQQDLITAQNKVLLLNAQLEAMKADNTALNVSLELMTRKRESTQESLNKLLAKTQSKKNQKQVSFADGDDLEHNDGDKASQIKQDQALVERQWAATQLEGPDTSANITEVMNKCGKWTKLGQEHMLKTAVNMKKLQNALLYAADFAKLSFTQMAEREEEIRTLQEEQEFAAEKASGTISGLEKVVADLRTLTQQQGEAMVEGDARKQELERAAGSHQAEIQEMVQLLTLAKQEQKNLQTVHATAILALQTDLQTAKKNATEAQNTLKQTTENFARSELTLAAHTTPLSLVDALQVKVQALTTDLEDARQLHNGCSTLSARIKSLEVLCDLKDKEKGALSIQIEKLSLRLNAARVTVSGTEDENRLMCKQVSLALAQAVADHAPCAGIVSDLKATVANLEATGGQAVVSMLQANLASIQADHGPCEGIISDLTTRLKNAEKVHAECPSKQQLELDSTSLITFQKENEKLRILANESADAVRTLAGLKRQNEKRKERELECLQRMKSMKPLLGCVLKTSSEGGVTVHDPQPETPVVAAGLLEGDRIVSFNQVALESIADYRTAVKDAELLGEPKPVLFVRPGDEKEQLTMVTLGAAGYNLEQIKTVTRLASYAKKSARDYQTKLPSLPIPSLATGEVELYY